MCFGCKKLNLRLFNNYEFILRVRSWREMEMIRNTLLKAKVIFVRQSPWLQVLIMFFNKMCLHYSVGCFPYSDQSWHWLRNYICGTVNNRKRKCDKIILAFLWSSHPHFTVHQKMEVTQVSSDIMTWSELMKNLEIEIKAQEKQVSGRIGINIRALKYKIGLLEFENVYVTFSALLL